MDINSRWNTAIRPLIWGFAISLLLLVITYQLPVKGWLTGDLLRVTIFSLVTVQAIVQLVFFLHLGIESKPRWNLMIFFFMLLMIFILVVGSLWIMHNLNYNVMSSI